MTWWLLKPLGEFLSGFWAHLSILRLDYKYSSFPQTKAQGWLQMYTHDQVRFYRRLCGYISELMLSKKIYIDN